MNPFKILGITSAASKAQIRAAYFQKAKELHPDSPTGSPQKFKELHEAYVFLSSNQKPPVFTSDETSINFSSLVKNYRRAGKNSFQAQRRSEDLTEKKESRNGFGFLGFLVFFGTGVGGLYLMDSSESRLGDFEVSYKKCCNAIEYPRNNPFEGDKWKEIKY